MKLRHFWMACAALVAGLVPSVATGNPTSRAGLSLSVTADGPQYLEGQPIAVLVCATNHGPGEFRDVAPMFPAYQFLRLSLQRVPDHAPMRVTGPKDLVAFSSAGITLEQGESLCEAVDLLNWFGYRCREGMPGAMFVDDRWLAPGEYELDAWLVSRTTVDRTLPQAIVHAPKLRFRITPVDSSPAEARTLAELEARAGDASIDPNGRAHLLRQVLPSFYGSPFFLAIYTSLGRDMTEVPIDSALTALARAGAGPAKRAAFLDMRLKIEPIGDAEKSELVRSLSGRYPDPASRAILESWRIKLDQKRYYYSFGK